MKILNYLGIFISLIAIGYFGFQINNSVNNIKLNKETVVSLENSIEMCSSELAKYEDVLNLDIKTQGIYDCVNQVNNISINECNITFEDTVISVYSKDDIENINRGSVIMFDINTYGEVDLDQYSKFGNLLSLKYNKDSIIIKYTI